MNTVLLRQWLTLTNHKRSLETELEETKSKLAAMDDSVKEEFVDSGVDNIRLDGHTIYVSCDRWPKARDGDKPALVEALKANGYAVLVKEDFNTQSLRGVTNEMIRNFVAELPEEQRATFNVNDAIPAELKPFLEITEVFNVKARKS